MDINLKYLNKVLIFPAYIMLLFTTFSVPIAIAQEGLQFNVSSFIVEGDNPLTEQQALSVLNKYSGQQSGLEGLNAARDELEQLLASNGYPFYRVTLPPQELFDGAVKFRIVQFKLGKVIVEGNQHFSVENIKNSIPYLKVGESPNTQKISQSLSLANENPAKKVSLNFKAAEEPERIDALLRVQDNNPQSFYVQLNNSGTEDGAETRMSMGYQHNGLWGIDHGLTFTYTTAPDDSEAISQWGLTYSMPLYEHGASLSFLFSDSKIDSGTVAEYFEVSGSGSVAGVDYKRSLTRIGNYTHGYNTSLQIKNFTNNVSFLGQPIGTDSKTQPLTVGYNGALQKTSGQWLFNTDITMNLPGGTGNEDKDYDIAREGATADWVTFHFGVKYSHRFAGNALLNFKISGQQTGNPLVSGEQFGVGGAHSVRGYDDRSVSGDTGYEAGIEYWFSPIFKGSIRPLIFYDMADVSLLDVQAGQTSGYSISSVGVGMRYSWKKSVSVSLDVANPMVATDEIEEGETKAHISVLVNF